MTVSEGVDVANTNNTFGWGLSSNCKAGSNLCLDFGHMVRISIPTLPTNLLPSYSRTITSLDLAVPVLEAFLKDRRVCVLTGAGVSVESGIRAYRGKEGRYMNPNYQ